MKKILTLMVFMALFLAASCHKEDSNCEKQMTQQEQIEYINNALLDALQFIQVSDFQNLSYIHRDMMSLPKFTTDTKSINAWDEERNQFKKEINNGFYYLYDLEKLSGLVNVNSKDSTFAYKRADEGIIHMDVEGVDEYTADAEFLSNYDKVIKIKEKDTTTSNFTLLTKSIMPKDGDVFVYAPEYLKIKFDFNNKLYADGEFSTDFTNMPEDFSSLRNPMEIFANSNFDMFGTVRLDGEESYLINVNHLEKIDSIINVDCEIYGVNREFILTVNGVGIFELDTVKNVNKNKYDFEFILNDLNIMNRIHAVLEGYNIKVYLNGYSNPQMVINSSSGEILFSDGTKSTVKEFFSKNNFNESISVALLKIKKLKKMFRIND